MARHDPSFSLRTQAHKSRPCVSLYLVHPVPVVLRCYLSLTCQGCQVLIDGKQIEWRERQDVNNASFWILPLLCLSLLTQLLVTVHGSPAACLKGSVSLSAFQTFRAPVKLISFVQNIKSVYHFPLYYSYNEVYCIWRLVLIR